MRPWLCWMFPGASSRMTFFPGMLLPFTSPNSFLSLKGRPGLYLCFENYPVPSPFLSRCAPILSSQQLNSTGAAQGRRGQWVPNPLTELGSSVGVTEVPWGSLGAARHSLFSLLWLCPQFPSCSVSLEKVMYLP